MRRFFIIVLVIGLLSIGVNASAQLIWEPPESPDYVNDSFCDLYPNTATCQPEEPEPPPPTTSGVSSLAAYADNGDLVGYVAGTDTSTGFVTIYNPTMDKFFEMNMNGFIKGFSRENVYADSNCKIYLYGRYANFVYSNTHTDWPRLTETGDFATFSNDPADAVTLSDLVYRPWRKYSDTDFTVSFSCEDVITYVKGEPVWVVVENPHGEYQHVVVDWAEIPVGNPPEISQWLRDYFAYHYPDYEFMPAIPYTEAFPFKYPAGVLTFDTN